MLFIFLSILAQDLIASGTSPSKRHYCLERTPVTAQPTFLYFGYVMRALLSPLKTMKKEDVQPGPKYIATGCTKDI